MSKDHHVHCFDIYSLHQSYDAKPVTQHGPLDVLCRVPVDKNHGKPVSPSVLLFPGVEALDLYGESGSAEIWKSSAVVPCLVPKKVYGWEFYNLLWTKPEGTSPLNIAEHVELLVGRPPGAAATSSLLFAYVPKGYQYHIEEEKGVSASMPSRRDDGHVHAPPAFSAGGLALNAAAASASAVQPKPVGGMAPTSAHVAEQKARNLDMRGRTIKARLVVLLPTAMFKDQASLPDDPLFSLFIGPRSRSLVLLNKQRGRIDLNLATLLGVDSAFYRADHLVQATARLFEPFGTRDHVHKLFGDVDPLKMHSAFTSASHADHVDVTADGRKDYAEMFGARLPSFFIGNSSGNLCYLTPQEAHSHRKGEHNQEGLGIPHLPDLPVWSVEKGVLNEEARQALLAYREKNPPNHAQLASSQASSGWLSFLDCCSIHGSRAQATPALPPPPPAEAPQALPPPPGGGEAPGKDAYGGTFAGLGPEHMPENPFTRSDGYAQGDGSTGAVRPNTPPRASTGASSSPGRYY